MRIESFEIPLRHPSQQGSRLGSLSFPTSALLCSTSSRQTSRFEREESRRRKLPTSCSAFGLSRWSPRWSLICHRRNLAGCKSRLFPRPRKCEWHWSCFGGIICSMANCKKSLSKETKCVWGQAALTSDLATQKLTIANCHWFLCFPIFIFLAKNYERTNVEITWLEKIGSWPQLKIVVTNLVLTDLKNEPATAAIVSTKTVYCWKSDLTSLTWQHSGKSEKLLRTQKESWRQLTRFHCQTADTCKSPMSWPKLLSPVTVTKQLSCIMQMTASLKKLSN